MPAIGYPFNLINGLSSFWTQFFADADQLNALYKGSAILIGQAYLDYMSAVLGIALKDALALDRELYYMLTIREDEISFVEGDTTPDNRWSFTLPSPVVSFVSIDNTVVAPSASLEQQRDYDVGTGTILFKVDPTNPTNTGVPLPGYARRSIDVDVGGSFADTAVTTWTLSPVNKGDTIRVLDIGTDGSQRKVNDYDIVVVRDPALFVSSSLALPVPASGINYVILRVPSDAAVLAESVTIIGGTITLAHNRVDHGSLRIFAKGPTGADVVEGADYSVNYEAGVVTVLSIWQNLPGPYGANYTWQEEIYPTFGSEPRFSANGVIVSSTTTTRVLQIAAWAPDALVDRMTLANNFGALIGRQEASSEAYRAFLQGIFQLYILGPVLERIESAMNVVLNLPVVRNDGELFQSVDTSDPVFDRVLTLNPVTNQTLTYAFPKGTPLRTDLDLNTVLNAFEPLTTAVTVTDYVQTPDWWYSEVIPQQLFGETLPITRRLASPFYVQNIIDPVDGAQIGDPGLIIGADENGFVATNGQPPLRHRMAFVLMDRYLKYHTFSVKFDAAALSATTGIAFAQSLQDLNNLVLSAKPAHTYAFTAPTTGFEDDITIDEDDISFARLVGSRVHGPDEVIFTDDPPLIGGGVWTIGDYFKYELWTASTTFTTISVPVTLANAPAGPRHGYLVRVFVEGDVGGVALIENVDYTIDYANRTVTRLTVWTTSTVNVVYRQLNIGNLSDAAIGVADMPLFINGVDPAAITATYDSSAEGWDGVSNPPTAPRDIGMVERALIVYAHA